MPRFDGAKLARQLVLGIDIGTSSVKALFLEPFGDFVARDEMKLPLTRDGNRVEQDPWDYVNAVRSLLQRNLNLVEQTVAIGLSGQTPTVVCIDEKGNPTSPALIWQDNRAEKEAADLRERFGNPVSVIGTSLPWSPSACPAKLLWLSQNNPNVVSKSRWVLQPKDFVGFHLTGTAVSDPWSTKGLCNVITRTAIDELLNYVGWSPEVVPHLADGYESRGEVSAHGAELFGIKPGIPVSVGWSDAMCGMLALGVMTQPTSFIITGTSAIVGASSRENPADGGGLYVIPQTCAPMSITYGPTQMSGGSISWMSEVLGLTSDELITAGSKDSATSTPIFLPYINGERAPLWRNEIRGRLIDIDITHSRGSFARAAMEGISWAERQVVNEAERLTKCINERVVLGGHAGNDNRWEKIRMRTLGRSIARYEDADTTTRGSAMLAYAIKTSSLESAFEALSIKPVLSDVSEEDRKYAEINFVRYLEAQKSLLAESDTAKERP